MNIFLIYKHGLAPTGSDNRFFFSFGSYAGEILSALKDVSDSLASYQETRERREEEAEHVKSAADAVRLARLRYSGGNASYLEVLTTDTDLYSAQLILAEAQLQEASSLVQLYSALGGGWQ